MGKIRIKPKGKVKLKNIIIIVSIVLLLLFNGCSVAFYGRIGSQELKDVEFKIKSQKADPNIPNGLVGTLVEVLEAL